MKKLLLTLLLPLVAHALAFTTAVNATSYTGTYKVGNTLDATFKSLSVAVDSLNKGTISGNIVLEITSDIAESTNFGLGVDMGTYSLTIRPDQDADRTITFSQATGNAGPYGHFVIGCKTADLALALADGTVITTNNVTIDGYAAGGTTRRLKLTTTADALAGSVLLNIVGGATNVKIKNCILDNKATGTSPRCIYITQFKGSTLSSAPQNTVIENNIITAVPATTTVNGTAIQCTRSASGSTVSITGLQILNNVISASNTCVEVYYVNGVVIKGNEIKVQKGTGTGGAYGIWLRGSAGDMNINGNKFTEASTSQASSTAMIQAISVAASSTNAFNANIYNNTFSGMDRKATGATAINQYYIGDVGYGTTKIYHNSFYMPALTQPTQAGVYYAVGFTATSYKADIQNNIFISNEDAKSVLISKAVTSGSMNNNVYYLRAGNSNAKIVDTYATFSAYRTANTTLDVDSKNVDVVFANAASGNLLIAGSSVQDVNLRVPSLASVTTDIAGTTRNTSFTYAGAHESTLPFIITGLANPTSGLSIRKTATGIEVSSTEPTTISIYRANGILTSKSIVHGTTQLDLGYGVYLLKTDKETIKVIR